MEIMRFPNAILIAARKLNNFDVRKFKMMSHSKTAPFIYDAMPSVITPRTETERREDPIQATTQMLIKHFSRKLTETHRSDDQTEEDLAIPQSSLCNACSNCEDLKTKANFDEELMHPYCTAERRVCHVLGLEIDFLHRSGFDKLPEHIKDHWSIEEWICNFLKENCEREKDLPENATLSDTDLLQRVGFRTDGDAVNTLLNRASSLKEHLHTFDWAEMYVRDEFKYNPVLSGTSPRFPFDRYIREEWLILPMGKKTADIHVINLEGRNITSYIKQDGCFSFPLGLEDETHKIMFHGTDHDSARDIFIHGARITQGRKNRDFSCGSGFYLTDDFEHSVEWAFCSTCKPVVLVYRVKRSLLEAFSGYSLIGEDKRNKWIDLVTQYRSGKPSKKLRKFLRVHDYIDGPRASSCDPASPKPKGGTYQMCVISDEFAVAVDGSLHSAVFYVEN